MMSPEALYCLKVVASLVGLVSGIFACFLFKGLVKGFFSYIGNQTVAYLGAFKGLNFGNNATRVNGCARVVVSALALFFNGFRFLWREFLTPVLFFWSKTSRDSSAYAPHLTTVRGSLRCNSDQAATSPREVKQLIYDKDLTLVKGRGCGGVSALPELTHIFRILRRRLFALVSTFWSAGSRSFNAAPAKDLTPANLILSNSWGGVCLGSDRGKWGVANASGGLVSISGFVWHASRMTALRFNNGCGFFLYPDSCGVGWIKSLNLVAITLRQKNWWLCLPTPPLALSGLGAEVGDSDLLLKKFYWANIVNTGEHCALSLVDPANGICLVGSSPLSGLANSGSNSTAIGNPPQVGGGENNVSHNSPGGGQPDPGSGGNFVTPTPNNSEQPKDPSLDSSEDFGVNFPDFYSEPAAPDDVTAVIASIHYPGEDDDNFDIDNLEGGGITFGGGGDNSDDSGMGDDDDDDGDGMGGDGMGGDGMGGDGMGGGDVSITVGPDFTLGNGLGGSAFNNTQIINNDLSVSVDPGSEAALAWSNISVGNCGIYNSSMLNVAVASTDISPVYPASQGLQEMHSQLLRVPSSDLPASSLNTVTDISPVYPATRALCDIKTQAINAPCVDSSASSAAIENSGLTSLWAPEEGPDFLFRHTHSYHHEKAWYSINRAEIYPQEYVGAVSLDPRAHITPAEWSLDCTSAAFADQKRSILLQSSDYFSTVQPRALSKDSWFINPLPERGIGFSVPGTGADSKISEAFVNYNNNFKGMRISRDLAVYDPRFSSNRGASNWSVDINPPFCGLHNFPRRIDCIGRWDGWSTTRLDTQFCGGLNVLPRGTSFVPPTPAAYSRASAISENVSPLIDSSFSSVHAEVQSIASNLQRVGGSSGTGTFHFSSTLDRICSKLFRPFSGNPRPSSLPRPKRVRSGRTGSRSRSGRSSSHNNSTGDDLSNINVGRGNSRSTRSRQSGRQSNRQPDDILNSGSSRSNLSSGRPEREPTLDLLTGRVSSGSSRTGEAVDRVSIRVNSASSRTRELAEQASGRVSTGSSRTTEVAERVSDSVSRVARAAESASLISPREYVLLLGAACCIATLGLVLFLQSSSWPSGTGLMSFLPSLGRPSFLPGPGGGGNDSGGGVDSEVGSTDFLVFLIFLMFSTGIGFGRYLAFGLVSGLRFLD